MSHDTIESYIELLIKLSSIDGITLQDYYFLIEMVKSLNSDDLLYKKITHLLSMIRKDGRLFKYSHEEINYMKEKTYLLPLVLANNDGNIKMTGDNSYLFMCQFNKEEHPSMSVTDSKNILHCFGCGKTLNVISYLQEKENISFPEALKLLTSIYFLGEESSSLLHLVYKYQSAILSPNYSKLLSEGLKRFYERGISEVDNTPVDELYFQRFNTIMRIRRKETDTNYKLIREKRKVILNMEEF